MFGSYGRVGVGRSRLPDNHHYLPDYGKRVCYTRRKMADHVHTFRGVFAAKRCHCGKTPADECRFGHLRTGVDAYQREDGQWICRICQRRRVKQYRADSKAGHPEQYERVKANMRRKAAKLGRRRKAAAIAAYGGKCACCGECTPEFLTIDHIRNDGRDHRIEMRTGGQGIYRWLEANGYPQDGRFRVLCFNCNMGRSVAGGVCPHQQKDAT